MNFDGILIHQWDGHCGNIDNDNESVYWKKVNFIFIEQDKVVKTLLNWMKFQSI